MVAAGVLALALGMVPGAAATPESDLLTRLGELGGGQGTYLDAYPTIAVAKANVAARLQVDLPDSEVAGLGALVTFLQRHSAAWQSLPPASAVPSPEALGQAASSYEGAKALLADLQAATGEPDNVDLALVGTTALLRDIGDAAHGSAASSTALPTALRIRYLELSVAAYSASSADTTAIRTSVQSELDDLRKGFDADMRRADGAVLAAGSIGRPPSSSLPDLMGYYATGKHRLDRLAEARERLVAHGEATRLEEADEAFGRLEQDVESSGAVLLRSLAPYLLASVLLCAWAVRATLGWAADVRVAGLGSELQVT